MADRSVHWTLSRADANVVRQALSRCAAERRIAASREVDRERVVVLSGQAAEYERIAASLPPVARPRRTRAQNAARRSSSTQGLVSPQI